MSSPTSIISRISPPLITPHASPPIHTQVRRSSSTSTRTTTTTASKSVTLSAEERLSKLLSTISSVLVAYSKSLNASPRYTNSLIDFYHRAVSLSPNPKAVPRLPTPLISPPSSESHGSRSRPNPSLSSILLQSHPPVTHKHGRYHKYNIRRKSDQINMKDMHEHTHNEANKNQHNHSRQVDDNSRDGLQGLEDRVRKLERECWTSEIVAAWYGPTVNPILSRRLSDSSTKPSCTASPMSRRQSLTNMTLPGSPSIESKEKNKEMERRTSSFTLLSEYRKKKQRDEWLEPILRRDASYVGLHDE
ncbi:hypothetical protein I203_101892 [Kwoniella mangroviensis CBS 8507]|uniref:uncharacterized protein n=1 Tax=Kwoniella mangroviensis CBS 8507 TaxID=1296122 RepID=UPI00080CE261|nr:uncharacterized protein I203_03088 [Kwoniella mangroviensis CBS 8507]OCF67394.1 hypothetical protein I203_03088 [Kwoniella mangroviensis CBS 8507]